MTSKAVERMWIHTGGYRWLRGKLVNNKCILTPLNLAGKDVNAKTLFKASIHVLFGSGSHKTVKQ